MSMALTRLGGTTIARARALMLLPSGPHELIEMIRIGAHPRCPWLNDSFSTLDATLQSASFTNDKSSRMERSSLSR